jgi:hypothetical protein
MIALACGSLIFGTETDNHIANIGPVAQTAISSVRGLIATTSAMNEAGAIDRGGIVQIVVPLSSFHGPKT